MNFTAAGLAQIKTPEFLRVLQQIPDFHTALVLVAIAACSDGKRCLVCSDEYEIRDFINSHWNQFLDLMTSAQSAIIARHSSRLDPSLSAK